MFTSKMPHLQIALHNPVFDLELHRIRRLRSYNSLTRYSRLVLLIPYSAILIWWLLTVVAFALAPGVQKFVVYDIFVKILVILLVIIAFAIPIAALLVDVYAMIVTLNSLNREMNSGHWDLLRLTPLSQKDCIAAKHGAAQVRAWRVLAIEMGVRMLSVVLMIVSLTFDNSCIWSSLWAGSYRCYVQIWPLFNELIPDLSQHFVNTMLWIIVMSGLIVVYITEPMWRMRVITALGLAISASIHNLQMASLAAFGVLTGLHIAQAVIFVAVIMVGNSFYRYYPTLEMQIAEVVVAIGLLILFYWKLHHDALTFARWMAFRSE